MPRKDFPFIRRMNLKAQDLLMPDEDLRLVVNAKYEKSGALRKVKGYTQVGDTLSATTATQFRTDADWGTGAFSSTETLNNTLLLTGGSISQILYNDSHQVYGANWFSQSFVATSTSINKVALYLDKVIGSALNLYDDFSDNSIDSTKWTTTGRVREESGELRLAFRTLDSGSTADTDGKTNGDPIKGGRWLQTAAGNGTSGGSTTIYTEITDGTNRIRINHDYAAGQMYITLSGTYGSGEVSRWSGNESTIEIKESSGDITITNNGVLQYSISAQTIASNSYFRSVVNNVIITSGEFYMRLKDVYFYQTLTAITDLDVRIESDNAGVPSGSAISNGTTTIDDANVQSSVSQLEAVFSTPPTTVVGTTYWIVVKQTGGDSSNYYRIYKQNSPVYSDGAAYYSTNSGAAWAVDPDGDTDMAFILYGAYNSTGTWISPNITLSTGQTLSQLVLDTLDLSTANYIDRIDILDTSNAVQSSYTTDITSGTQKIIRSTDMSFSYTNGNTFRVKITLVSAGTISPGVSRLSVDNPETKILELSPFYQASGTKALMAIVAGTLKRLTSGTWATILPNLLTSGLDTDTIIFRASKGPKIANGAVASATATTFVDTSVPAPNAYQGKMVKIVSGPGAGQVRIIQSNTGTTTSTSTSSSTTTSTTTTRSTSTTKSTSTTAT